MFPAGAYGKAKERDRDRDRLSDGYEVTTSKTNPRRKDTDRDRLTDGYEVRIAKTNPRRKDTDRDRLTDGYEVRIARTNPRKKDTDGDGLTDGYEVRVSKTNPRKKDTDGDGVSDGLEVLLGSDPLKKPPKPLGGDPPVPAPLPPVVPLPDLLPPETMITTGPNGTVTTASAAFTFDSSEGGSTFQCRIDAGAWGACTSPKNYSGLANGSHTFNVRATDVAGNTDPLPASRSWTVDVAPDTTAPNTSISSGPTGTVNSTSASFSFSSTESGSTFQCRIDAGAWGACTSPKGYSGLASGSHIFEVRATDSAGNTDGSPASRTWTIDTAAPDTTISSGPSGTVASDSGSFSFSSSEAGSTFQCRLDASAWAACTSPKSYSGLGNGPHTFDVRAVDGAGNADPSPASQTWTVAVVDLTPPETMITSGPSGTVASSAGTFSFSSSESGSTFECRLNGGGWGLCSSPKSYSSLANGSHTFDVRATDGSGNVDATPASRTWTVDVSAAGDCHLNATPANYPSQVTAAQAGQTICLGAGAYGSFAGTNKAITIRMSNGATGTMSLNLNGSSDGNFTIDGAHTFGTTDGLTITSGDISGAVHDVTIKNSRVTGTVKILSHPHPNVVFDHNEHVGVPYDYPAIWLGGGSQQHSGVTVKNSLFRDMEADAIQTGPAMNIIDNEFARLGLGNTPAHTDAIQLYCGCGAPGIGSVVTGNYIHEGSQGIGAFDGAGSSVVEDNVVVNHKVHYLVLGGDVPGSIVQHNVVAGTGGSLKIDCSSKAGYDASRTIIRNNIALNGLQMNGGVNCQPTENRNNMMRSGASGQNFNGTPVFVGGANPTSYAGYRLAAGSPGKGAATDGSDVGIR